MPEKKVDGYADLHTEDDFKEFYVKPMLTTERTVTKLDCEKGWDFERRVRARVGDIKSMLSCQYDNPVFNTRVGYNRDRTRATIYVSLLKGKLKEKLR